MYRGLIRKWFVVEIYSTCETITLSVPSFRTHQGGVGAEHQRLGRESTRDVVLSSRKDDPGLRSHY